MTLPIFTPSFSPFVGITNKPEIKILKADFGDGYTQASPDGMNNIRDVISLSWDVLTPDDANQITAFFRARKGCEPFTYRLPGLSDAGKWTCEEWTDKAGTGGYRAITATFRQSFGLAS